MAKRRRIGVCCICGKNGKLSFEHVPPQAAYNETTVIAYHWEEHLVGRKSKGKPKQGGAGDYTLCQECNNNTGSWYANEYVKWSRTCHDIIVSWNMNDISQGNVCLLNVYPLRFLKQVVTCFFSLLGTDGAATFAHNNPDLVNFILDKQSMNLPSGFRFFLNLYPHSRQGNTPLRRWATAGKISTQFDPNGNIVPVDTSVFDEIAHPPFQLLMTQDNDPYNDATEITNFKDYGYDDRAKLVLDLRLISSESPLPGAG